ncbi:flagellar protein FliL [Siminovitchia terrae]|uniref:Flagellar protein FliL n=1 Tax=Siminovitchia terrae TaxID=1914933 RepID=A0A429XBE7_SIMTE|nr:flagellar basal body-associated protein FliL [Siminovitchia terrae]RST60756.1 flagellar basal body-associated protein FliL [Siminovitchia terrae]GIN91369.1 flagellar protein FliL [Siminovitchia terrae]GIN94696.1 flagellar protein FliL [Siminovitchia terrae]
MKNNKVLIIITVILLVGAAGLLTYDKLGLGKKEAASEEQSIDDVIKLSVDMGEIATNLLDNRYVKISFMVETDSKDAKEELEKRKFQVQNIIITELSDMKSPQLEGKEGKQSFEEAVKSRINEIMQEGEVVKVYITSYIIS